MASTHKSLRSSTADKRPTTSIADGQIALNTNSTSPGLFFKDSTGATIIKVGPVHVGTTAPNVTPAAGGSSGNSTGEVWLDTSLTPPGVKIWSGGAWTNATPAGSTTVQGLLELATNAETQAGADTARAITPAGLQSKVSDSTSTTSSTTIASSTAVKSAYDLAGAALPKSGGTVTGTVTFGTTGVLAFEGSTDDGFETAFAVTDPTADRTITFPDATGNAVVDTAGQTVQFGLGAAATPSLTFTGDTNTGIYSPGADQVAVATNGTGRLFVDASGNVAIIQSPVTTPSYTKSFNVSSLNASIALRANSSGTYSDQGIFFAVDGVNYSQINNEGVGQLVFRTGSGLSERLRITSAGLVGIGTSSPAGTINVQGSTGAPSTTYDTANIANFDAGTIQLALGIDNSAPFGAYLQGRATNDTSRVISLNPAGGNVGIGTTSPGFTLDVAGDARIGAPTGVVRLELGAGASGNRAVYMDFVGDTTYTDYGLRVIRAGDGANAVSAIQHRGTGEFRLIAQEAAPIAFLTTNTERARIDSSGRLLVGTSTALGTNNAIAIKGTVSNNASIYFGRNANASSIVAGNNLGFLEFGSGDSGLGARISSEADGTWSSTSDCPSRLTFLTTADGASSPTERMRINSAGLVELDRARCDAGGGLDFLPSTANRVVLRCRTTATTGASLVNFINSNGLVGSISVSGSATVYNTSSDYRLKENVTPVSDGITRLQQLKPSRFNFIADPDTVVDGFLAHEVQTIVPEAITGEKDAVDDEGNPEYQGIDQSKLVPLLTAALQEAIAKIETLEQRLNDAGIN